MKSTLTNRSPEEPTQIKMKIGRRTNSKETMNKKNEVRENETNVRRHKVRTREELNLNKNTRTKDVNNKNGLERSSETMNAERRSKTNVNTKTTEKTFRRNKIRTIVNRTRTNT